MNSWWSLDVCSSARSVVCVHVLAVTHSHPDHVGALPKLLQAYPDIKIAYHENEQPFLSGKGKYADLPGDNIQYNLMKHFIPQASSTIVPKSRALLLKGPSGDVSDAFTSVLWLPKGVLEYHAVPGHSPGQLAFSHRPTGSVMTGDAVVQTSAWFPFSAVKKHLPQIASWQLQHKTDEGVSAEACSPSRCRNFLSVS